MNRKLSLSCVALLGAALVGCGAPAVTGSGVTNVAGASNAAATTATSKTPSNPLMGQTVLDFTLQKLDGSGSVHLKDLLGKQPILLNVWASWCGPCQRETPDLVQAAEDYKGKIQFVGINMTSQDSASDAKAFVTQHHVQYTILTDPDASFLTDYRIIAFPTTFLVSPSGKILDAYVGGMTHATLQKLLQEGVNSHS